YLAKFEDYAQDMDKSIFVIDVQDIERYELALNYLKRIMEASKKINKDIVFSIYLHKFDPNLEKLDIFTDKIISAKLLDKIKEIIPPDFTYSIFKTTIYTVFQKTLM
ncbi:MAG: hypothetical protein ACTSVE_12910, partial [Candidatus Helarchaeota archaeon]